MPRPEKLDANEISAGLGALHGWTREGDRIQKSYRFRDFASAFAFMTEVAIAAERMNHHPEWSNVYATVDVALTTHDVGGISQLDLDLAAVCDRAASGRTASS